eukprot:2743242-Rhodomonas_salina.5
MTRSDWRVSAILECNPSWHWHTCSALPHQALLKQASKSKLPAAQRCWQCSRPLTDTDISESSLSRANAVVGAYRSAYRHCCPPRLCDSTVPILPSAATTLQR